MSTSIPCVTLYIRGHHSERGLSITSLMCHCHISAHRGHGTNKGVCCGTSVTVVPLLLAGNPLWESVSWAFPAACGCGVEPEGSSALHRAGDPRQQLCVWHNTNTAMSLRPSCETQCHPVLTLCQGSGNKFGFQIQIETSTCGCPHAALWC